LLGLRTGAWTGICKRFLKGEERRPVDAQFAGNNSSRALSAAPINELRHSDKHFFGIATA